MNPHEILRRFPLASKSLLAANAKDYGPNSPTDSPHPRKTAKPQPTDAGSELARPRQAQKAGAERVHLRITSVRKRLLDPDNLVPKWTIDALRYCGIIRGDEPDKITIETAQRKVVKGEEEHTLVEIFEEPK